MENKAFDKGNKAYDSVLGANAQDNQKKWILDIDPEDIAEGWSGPIMSDFLDTLQPHDGKNKTLAIIPSKSGLHVITRPFNLMEFKKDYPNIDVQKNNPTNLYIP